MNPLAKILNKTLDEISPSVSSMLSNVGKELYYPKGILSQTAEAKEKASRHNATIGIAKENGHPMHLSAVMQFCPELTADEVLPYAPPAGKPNLRQKWKEEMLRKNPSLLSSGKISDPIVTSGITHGLSLVADLFIDAGDTVMLPSMLWGNYNMTFSTIHGANTQKYPFFIENRGFDTDGFLRSIKSQVIQGKLILMLNFPNNPTGYSPTRQEVVAICDGLKSLAEENYRIVVVCDDAYFGLSYEPEVFKESMFGQLAHLHENILAVKLDGATKEDYVWGFRVGFITYGHISANTNLYQALEKKTTGAIRGNISNCSHISQAILLKALLSETYAKEKQEKYAILKRRAEKVKSVLDNDQFNDFWTPYPFNSGYFMCLKLKNLNAEEFRIRLLDKYNIGVIAIGDTDIRIAFSCIEEDCLKDLFDGMLECAKEMTKE